MIRPTIFLLFAGFVAYAQSTVTLNNQQYALKGHPRTLLDGPGGALDSRIKDPDGSGPLKAPKAVTTNPAWVALGTAVAAALPNYQADSQRYFLRDGGAVLQFATYWYADNSQTAAHDAAVYMLTHPEYYLPLVCVEDQVDCTNGGTGYGVTRYGITIWIPQWILAYELMRGQLTTAQQQAFAGKFLNDNTSWGGIDGDTTTGCVNPTVNAGQNVTITNPQWSVNSGTLTAFAISGTVGYATLGGGATTTGMAVGDSVHITGGTAAWNSVFIVLSITSPTQFTFGYIYGPPNGNYQTAGTTITYVKSYAVVTQPIFGTAVNLGDWIFDPANNVNLGIVSAIVDSTHAYLSGDISTTSSDPLYYRSKTWTPGQCGVIWHVKHDQYTPQVISGAAYPPSGGQNGVDYNQNLTYAAVRGLLMTYLSLADDDLNASARSGPELTALYNAWYSNGYSFTERFWTGFHQTGSGYGLAAAQVHVPGTAIAVQSSLVNPPSLMGNWAKNAMVLDYANTFPDAQGSQMQWGQVNVSGAFGNGMSPSYMIGFVQLAYWFRNTPEGQYANWWLQNIWAPGNAAFGNVPGTDLGFAAANLTNSGNNVSAWFFIFTDQSYPTTSLSGAPTTFPFNISDTGIPGQRADALISRTGFLSASDTLVNFHAEAVPDIDHNVDPGLPWNFGSYKIFKGHYLLAEDNNIDFVDENVAGFTGGGTSSNYVEVAGTPNSLQLYPVVSGIPRATGTNSYAYAMADVTQSYVSTVGLQHGYRHLVDFKGPLTQQFIVDYVDFRTSRGATKKAYYHYANKATTTLASNIVTSDNPYGVQTQLLTKILAPQPVLISSDTSGSTYRVDVCPSRDGATCDSTNTLAEMLVVHMPVAGWTNSLPSMSLLSNIDPNFTGVEIDGVSPKIAVFARNGQTYTAARFTSQNPGIAQILIAGLTPTASNGLLYTLVKDGNPVLRNQTVNSDGTIYFEGASGSYQVVSVQPAPVIRIAPLADAVQYQPYGQTVTATGGAVPLAWSVNSGSLPVGLSIDSAAGLISGVPVNTGASTFTVQVTDALGQTGAQPFGLNVDAAPPLQIETGTLTLNAGSPFSRSLSATGGGGLYIWSVIGGSIPSGISLASNGVLSGFSAGIASFSVTVSASDQYGNSATAPVTIQLIAVPVTSVTGVTVSGLTGVH